MKNTVADFAKGFGCPVSYSGKEKTMFIGGSNAKKVIADIKILSLPIGFALSDNYRAKKKRFL